MSPPGSVWRFEVDTAELGQVTHWCGVASIPFEDKRLLDEVRSLWRQRGEKPQIFEVGSVFGIQGHVIDNRTYILGIRPLGSQEKIKSLASQIFSRYGTKTFQHAHLSQRPSGSIRVKDAQGRSKGLALDLVRIRSAGSHPITVHRVEVGKGYKWHGFQNRKYTGDILVTFDQSCRLVVVNRIAIDRLLEGLVPAEMYPSAPMEALKAQAVVARGEVLVKIGTRHFLDPYLVCASTHCQVYAGVGFENPRTSQAIRSTRGELLFRGPHMVDSVYSASCGGHTENNEVVWSVPPSPALRGKLDMDEDTAKKWVSPNQRLGIWLQSSPPAFCNISSFNRKGLFRWSRTMSASEMNKLVAKTKPVGQVVSIQVLSRGVSGRVKVVRVVGTQDELVIQREWPIRKLFGNLKSGLFEIKVETNEDQMPVAFHFRGGGWGHGVGMCQIGAIGMAEQGYDYNDILAHYYRGAKVIRLYGKNPKGPKASRSKEPR